MEPQETTNPLQDLEPVQRQRVAALACATMILGTDYPTLELAADWIVQGNPETNTPTDTEEENS